MGSKSGTRSSRLFLLEMMIAVLFFSLGSAVCIQAFVRAHTDSLRAQELAFSSSAVSSAANALRYGGQDLGEYLPGAVAQGKGGPWYTMTIPSLPAGKRRRPTFWRSPPAGRRM